MKTRQLTLLILIFLVSISSLAQTHEGNIAPICDTDFSSINGIREYLISRNTYMLAMNVYEEVQDIPKFIYGEYGDILGDTIESLNLIHIGDDAMIAEYIYVGTLFTGDEYMRTNMLSPIDFHILMVSIFELKNGCLVSEQIRQKSSVKSRRFSIP